MRHPAVAGQFYAGDAEGLRREIDRCYDGPLGPGALPEPSERGSRRIVGGMAPHAGYMFSGMVAAHLYAQIAADGLPKTFVILSPNHTGRGTGVALSDEDFETPLGVARVDRDLVKALRKDIVDVDSHAHEFEHSVEVQLPFVQHLTSDFTFVPICMMFQDYDASVTVGKIIRDALKDRDAVVIASTDLSHYVTPATAKVKDRMVLDAIERMDPKGLYDVVMDENVSMCGYGPVMAMMTACEGGSARVLKWATSGDVRPMRDVVGYASVVVEKK
jgi:AmmeMemoRadiSam system protein B